MNEILMTTRPTKQLMKKVHEEHSIVLSFIRKPSYVNDPKTAKAFLNGWLKGLGLKPDHRLALILVPNGISMKLVKQKYVDNLKLELEGIHLDSLLKIPLVAREALEDNK